MHLAGALHLTIVKERPGRGGNDRGMVTLSAAFSHDHRRAERALETSAAHAAAARWEAAAMSFASFRRRIEQHMKIEEEVLFPAVEDHGETPLTAILRKGHRDLKVFFDEVDDAIAARDADEVARLLRAVRAFLERHDEKEESELYPAAQEKLAASAEQIARRLTE